MSRESEVVGYLRADSELGTLLPGGIYAFGDLPVSGIADARMMPDVWPMGVFQACAIVRQRAPTPTGQLQSIQSRRTSMSQVIEVWVFSETPDEIEAGLDRVYALMMGKRFSVAYSATWVGGLPSITQAPDLPDNVKVDRGDYRIVSIRRATA